VERVFRVRLPNRRGARLRPVVWLPSGLGGRHISGSVTHPRDEVDIERVPPADAATGGPSGRPRFPGTSLARERPPQFLGVALVGVTVVVPVLPPIVSPTVTGLTGLKLTPSPCAVNVKLLPLTGEIVKFKSTSLIIPAK